MILFAGSETVWAILLSPAHWVAEIIVTVVFDGLLAGLFYPMLRNCWMTWKHPMIEMSGTTFCAPDPYADLCLDCGGDRVSVSESQIDICKGCGDVHVLPVANPDEPSSLGKRET